MEFEIFPRDLWFIPITVLGLLGLVALAFLDYLLKNAREFSFFSPGAAAVLGFALYFRLSASPESHFGTLAMTIIVGALFGMAFAVALEYALRKPFYELNRRWRISLQ